MSAVNDAVEDGVTESRIADVSVPFVHRELAGDDGGSAAVAIVDDLQQIASLFSGERCQSPVIEDEDLHAGQALEHAGIATVTPGETKPFQHARHALIEHGAIIPAGAVTEGTGNPGLADTCWAGDQ